MFKTPIFCDRRIYDKKGKWYSALTKKEENIFYFVQEPLTLVPSYDTNGREQMKETMTIVIFGGKPIVKEDLITLEDGSKLAAQTITVNYFEPNILVKDMLKPRIESLQIVLE